MISGDIPMGVDTTACSGYPYRAMVAVCDRQQKVIVPQCVNTLARNVYEAAVSCHFIISETFKSKNYINQIASIVKIGEDLLHWRKTYPEQTKEPCLICGGAGKTHEELTCELTGHCHLYILCPGCHSMMVQGAEQIVDEKGNAKGLSQENIGPEQEQVPWAN